jgi:DnaJ-class molecular chaperone
MNGEMIRLTHTMAERFLREERETIWRVECELKRRKHTENELKQIVSATSKDVCPTCHGQRVVRNWDDQLSSTVDTCTRCNGTGVRVRAGEGGTT